MSRRFLYTARFVPLDRPVTLLDQNGRPFTWTYREDTFALQSGRPRDVKFCLRHDRDLTVGRFETLFAHRGWWNGTFTIDREGVELEVGDPVSVGLASIERGTGAPILREVSLVTRPRVEGARITSKYEIPESSAARGSLPSDRAPAAANEVIHGGEKIVRFFENAVIGVR